MKCPECGSTNTKKVSVRDPEWAMGGQQCLSCGHRDHWLRFCEEKVSKATADSLLGVEPK